LALDSGAASQTVLQVLMAREGVRIDRFEVAAPSLDDIFIRVVKEEVEVNNEEGDRA
jgi:ABC-2 type transport system ATP-binding protein